MCTILRYVFANQGVPHKNHYIRSSQQDPTFWFDSTDYGWIQQDPRESFSILVGGITFAFGVIDYIYIYGQMRNHLKHKSQVLLR